LVHVPHGNLNVCPTFVMVTTAAGRSPPNSIRPSLTSRLDSSPAEDMLIFVKPLLARLPIWQDRPDEAPEGAIMVAFAQVAELMDDSVFENGFRGEDQMPVEVYLPVGPAAPPEVLLVLDQDALGLHAVTLPVCAHIGRYVLAKALAQPEPDRALDDRIS